MRRDRGLWVLPGPEGQSVELRSGVRLDTFKEINLTQTPSERDARPGRHKMGIALAPGENVTLCLCLYTFPKSQTRSNFIHFVLYIVIQLQYRLYGNCHMHIDLLKCMDAQLWNMKHIFVFCQNTGTVVKGYCFKTECMCSCLMFSLSGVRVNPVKCVYHYKAHRAG